MSYKSLFKLFVMNNYEEFNKIYENKFNASSTVKLDLSINGHDAFFSFDADIISCTSKIRELDAKINRIFDDLPNIAKTQYMRKSLIDEIEFTNQIEGVISTRKDINDLIIELESKTKPKDRFEGIVNKYLLLTEDNLVFKTSEDVRKLYNDMLYNEIKEEDPSNLPDGKIFRKAEVHVLKSNDKIVHTGIMPESNIIDYMDKALKVLNDKNIDVLIRVSVFHYLFGYIHPFYDGNGRINRFISSYVLSQYFNNIIGFRLSMTIKENLSQYLDAFNHTNDSRNRGDISTFIYEFLDIILKSYQKTEIYALEKKQLLEYYIDKINECENLSDKEENLLNILVQCSLFGDFGLTKANLQDILGRGRSTISNLLVELKNRNLCKEIKSGRHCYYIANLSELDK